MRSLSIDPVVVRQNWLKAYNFVTDKAAVTLNEYARGNDPFAKVGRETVFRRGGERRAGLEVPPSRCGGWSGRSRAER